MCAIINPSKGKILIDDKYDIHSSQYKIRWLNKIGYVTQDIYLLMIQLRITLFMDRMILTVRNFQRRLKSHNLMK